MTFEIVRTLGLGASGAGLSLRYALLTTAGVIDATIRDVLAGFTEIENGYYQLFTSLPDGTQGTLVIYTGTLGADTDWSNVNVETTLSISQGTVGVTGGQPPPAVEGSQINVLRGDTFNPVTLSLNRDITGRLALWFTAKANITDADNRSDAQITEAGGLQYIGGSPPVAGQTGLLTVTNPVAGDITIQLSALATQALAPKGSGVWDVQIQEADGTHDTLLFGNWAVFADVTQVVNP